MRGEDTRNKEMNAYNIVQNFENNHRFVFFFCLLRLRNKFIAYEIEH